MADNQIYGNGNKVIWPALSAVAGLTVGVVGVIAFAYSQFFTLREHEEFRKTIMESNLRLEDRIKNVEAKAEGNSQWLAKIQGFLDAHIQSQPQQQQRQK
jgi:hypothetical protein